MAVIKGDFRYFAYYESIEEMKKDGYLEDKYLVTVIDKMVCVDYEIGKTKRDNGLLLDNGLYANPVYTGNPLSGDVHELYSTLGPIEYNIGGIQKGVEYQAVALSEIFDDMFYGTFIIDFEVSDNLIKEIHVKGELHKVTKLTVNLKRTKTKVVQQEVYVNGDKVFASEEFWVPGTWNLDVDIQFRDTTEIVVLLRDENGNAVEESIKEEFANPIFYGIINSNAEPTGTTIKLMQNIRDRSDLEMVGDLMAQSAFIALPIVDTVLDSVLDENNFNIKTIFSSYDTPVMLGEESEETMYRCYKSRELTIDNFQFTFKFKEVSDENSR